MNPTTKVPNVEFSTNYENALSRLAELFNHGKGDPEVILMHFESLDPVMAFCVAPRAGEYLSRLKNREVLQKFFTFCFEAPQFSRFENDRQMSRLLDGEDFTVVYENYKPVRIADKQK